MCPAIVANGVFGYGKFVFGAGTTFDMAKNTASGSKVQGSYGVHSSRVTQDVAVRRGLHRWQHGCGLLHVSLVLTLALIALLQRTWSSAEGGVVEGSLFHVPSNTTEMGVQFAWNGDSNTSFGVAGRYVLDADTFFKAKVDKSLNMNLSYVQNIRPGVTMRLSADVRYSDCFAFISPLTLRYYAGRWQQPGFGCSPSWRPPDPERLNKAPCISLRGHCS